MARINPPLLRHYRELKKWSQEDLSRVSRVDKGTIFRIEAGRMKRNTQNVIDKLAKSLKVESEKLTASDVEGVPSSGESPLFSKTQLNVRVAPHVRNALALVSLRYQVSQIEVIEFAPLLFHLAASESLKMRGDHLSALRAVRDTVGDFSGRFNHLTERLLCDWQAEEVELSEQNSIAKRDLRGASIDDDDCQTDPRPLDYDEDETNPFVVHLRERLSAVQSNGQDDRLEYWLRSGSVHYEICRQEALEWFGGDEDAAHDLVVGSFSMADIPKDIRAAGTLERVSWANAERAERNARFDEEIDLLGIGSPS